MEKPCHPSAYARWYSFTEIEFIETANGGYAATNASRLYTSTEPGRADHITEKSTSHVRTVNVENQTRHRIRLFDAGPHVSELQTRRNRK